MITQYILYDLYFLSKINIIIVNFLIAILISFAANKYTINIYKEKLEAQNKVLRKQYNKMMKKAKRNNIEFSISEFHALTITGTPRYIHLINDAFVFLCLCLSGVITNVMIMFIKR